MAAIARDGGDEVDAAGHDEGDAGKRACSRESRVQDAAGRAICLFVTYSGHGGQIPDVNGEEEDKKDETWCLYDGELIDDEVFLELSRFAAGVRVLVLSDSCHSGTVMRARVPEASSNRAVEDDAAVRRDSDLSCASGFLRQAAARRRRGGRKGVRPKSRQRAGARRREQAADRHRQGQCKASVILISGCQDNQTSMDGDHNGAFTEQLLHVWNHGTFAGNYAQFHAAIKARMPRTQTPNLFTLGPVGTFLTESSIQPLRTHIARDHARPG